MVDDGLRVGFAQDDSRFRQGVVRSVPRTVDVGRLKALKLRLPLAHIGAVEIELFRLQHRKIRKEGAESIPAPATHCQLSGLFAGSASISVSQNHVSPCRQSMSRCLTRKEATIRRARLGKYPVRHNCRMPASTIG